VRACVRVNCKNWCTFTPACQMWSARPAHAHSSTHSPTPNVLRMGREQLTSYREHLTSYRAAHFLPFRLQPHTLLALTACLWHFLFTPRTAASHRCGRRMLGVQRWLRRSFARVSAAREREREREREIVCCRQREFMCLAL